MEGITPEIRTLLVEMFADGRQRRVRHADRVWDVLGSTERHLFAEGAVLGYAQGIRHNGPDTDPEQVITAEHIAYHVISTCDSMSDLHRFLGQITRRRRPRNTGDHLMQGFDLHITRELLAFRTCAGLAALVGEDRGRAEQTWAALTVPERHLTRNALVVGFVHGVRDHGPFDAIVPSDSDMIAKVLHAAAAFPGQFPTLGGALARRRAGARA